MPAAATTAIISPRLLVWGAAATTTSAGAALPLMRLRSGGISATRVKTRRLWARTTRGRSALLAAAMTTTEEKAPGIAARRAVTGSQPWTRSR